jgi:hypothetical protein
MEVTSNVKGQLALTKTELRALELGYVPSRPIFDTRYDLIIDTLEGLKRVQVKYANGKPSQSLGSVIVNLLMKIGEKKVFTYKNKEVDGLIVYIPKIDKLCFIPPHMFVGKRNLCIRLEKPKNNQTKGVIFASDYYW